MAKAKAPGGLYYNAQGVAVDANNDVIEGAPKRPEDTPAELQPGGQAVQTPEDRLALALAKAIKGDVSKAQNAEEYAAKQDEKFQKQADKLSDTDDEDAESASGRSAAKKTGKSR